MHYFFSSGEASGELSATTLAEAIRRLDPDAVFEGIGAARMRGAGFRLWRDHSGWASFGPLAAVPRIPRLLLEGFRTASHIARTKPDLVVLVDFGGFNVRLAKQLRRIGYGGAILDLFPPGAWLDDPKRAREIAAVAVPLTGFAHQRDFFASLDLPIAYFGHPLVSRYAMRPARPPAPLDGGTVALLPGSRRAELRYHVPALLDAYAYLRHRRPRLRAIAGAADDSAANLLRAQARGRGIEDLAIARGTLDAIREADAAWVSSGTAVLECALTGTPAVALYIVSRALARYVRRVYRRPFVTLPNLVLGSEVVPEFLQARATSSALAGAMDRVLTDPGSQYERLRALREALGPADALERCAAFAVALARSAA